MSSGKKSTRVYIPCSATIGRGSTYVCVEKKGGKNVPVCCQVLAGSWDYV